MIYGLCRMIYLLRKYIISVPFIREAYIIRVSGSHRASDIIRDQTERISLKKKPDAKASGFFFMVREGGVEGMESTPKLRGLPWRFGFGGQQSPSVHRR